MSGLLTVIGYASVILVALMISVLVFDLVNLLWPRRVVIRDENGVVLGEISADIVTEKGAATKLERLSERVKQGHVVTTSTVY